MKDVTWRDVFHTYVDSPRGMVRRLHWLCFGVIMLAVNYYARFLIVESGVNDPVIVGYQVLLLVIGWSAMACGLLTTVLRPLPEK